MKRKDSSLSSGLKKLKVVDTDRQPSVVEPPATPILQRITYRKPEPSTPHKPHKQAKASSKCLFPNESSSYEDVVDALRLIRSIDPSMHDDLVNFFKLVSNGKFPLSNIAFLLFLDTIRWYSSSTISQVRFRDECIQFFLVGWVLFGGQFLRFIQGTRLIGSKDMEVADSVVNFGMPSENSMRRHLHETDTFTREVHPGLLPTINMLPTLPHKN